MRVLVVGSGGREHALCRSISRSSRLSKLFICPGNAGTAALGTNIPGDADDIDHLLAIARRESIDLTVVGPEDPLAAGVVDAFEATGLRIFGPSAAAARLEADKAFAKQIMHRAGVPTAEARIFGPTEQERLQARQVGASSPNEITAGASLTGYQLARQYVESRKGDEALVVKAAGLAKGKGAFVCANPPEALDVLERIMVKRELGAAGDTVLVEECLTGREVSVMALVDGRNIYVLEPAQDYKRLLDEDEGPNTGGMGAFCPSDAVDEPTLRRIERQVLVPIVDGLVREGVAYRGVLYAGLMLTPSGPKVLEFNCRFGDPEAQVLLMRLRSDLLDVLEAVVDGRLDEITIEWDARAAVCVVMASPGYPGAYPKGLPISGLPDDASSDSSAVFHAGTRLQDGRCVTCGGRVLGVTALGSTCIAARDAAYRIARGIHFDGVQSRGDIAG